MANFWESSVWTILIQVFIIALALGIGNLIRRKVPIVKKSLLPSAVIGGILLLIIKSVWPWFNNLININFMSNVTYHALALGFIALAVKNSKKDKKESRAPVIINTGIVTVNGYIIQGVIGLVITIPLALVMGDKLLSAAGLILPLGFGQGTGQALSFGTIYENTYGFVGGASFGLTIATAGFLVACIVGVIYLNILRRKGKIKIESQETTKKELIIEDENEIPLSESIDKLTVQVVIITLVYGFTYLFMYGFSAILDAGLLGNFGINTVKPLIWGFNFLFGTIFAIVLKAIFKILQKKKVMTHVYPSNYLLNRLSGMMFDIMIVSGILAIQLEFVLSLWLPILLLTIGGTVVTLVYLNIVRRYLWKDYEYQGMISMFGMLTGTASTGIILLREIDPNFETPAADNLVFQSVFAMIFGFPILLLVGYAPQSPVAVYISLGVLSALFVVYNLILYRKKIFKKKNKAST